jgi:hypothetical protein
MASSCILTSKHDYILVSVWFASMSIPTSLLTFNRASVFIFVALIFLPENEYYHELKCSIQFQALLMLSNFLNVVL